VIRNSSVIPRKLEGAKRYGRTQVEAHRATEAALAPPFSPSPFSDDDSDDDGHKPEPEPEPPAPARPPVFERLSVRAHPGRLSALSVLYGQSGLYGAFVWARRALNRQKMAVSGPGRRRPAAASGQGRRAAARIAAGESAIKRPTPLNALKDAHDRSCSRARSDE
jgi:hypothetical protein